MTVSTSILSYFITWPTALERIATWAAHRESRTVCICNAHSVVTATQDPRFCDVLAARLWRRYLVTNTLFIVGAARQLLGSR